jgi:predicted nucleotidyltransferase
MTKAVEDLRERVLPTLRRYGVRKAAVFGSYAKGLQKAGSDVDLLVEFEDGRSLFDLAGLRIDLTDLLGRETDVVTYNSLHPRLRKTILEDQVPILG